MVIKEGLFIFKGSLTWDHQSRSEAVDNVIIGILLALARTSGINQIVSCVKGLNIRIAFSYRNLLDVTKSITESP